MNRRHLPCTLRDASRATRRTRTTFRSVAVASFAAVLVLSACASNEGAEAAYDASKSPLGKLKGSELCQLLPKDKVEKLFDVTVKNSNGGEVFRGPYENELVNCKQDLEGGDDAPLHVWAWVTRARDAGKAIDAAFSDPGGKLHEYQEVEGLGDAAGFGHDPAEDPEVGTYMQIATMFQAEGDVFTVRISVLGDARLEQLKQIAGVLLDGVEAELG